jgi:phosphoglycolate phosphatase
MIRLIAFDLDGTLIDSQRDLAESGNELLTRYQAPPLANEAVVAMVGEGARRLVSRLLAAAGLAVDVDEALRGFLEIYNRRLVIHTRPYPGIPEALRELKKRRQLAVLTNKPRRAALDILNHFNLLDLFMEVIGGDGPAPRKPDPSGLHALRDRADAQLGETLVIGDSWVDVETARRARVHAGLVTYGFGARPPGGLRPGELEIHQPDEIAGLVASLNGSMPPAATLPLSREP